MTEEEFEALLRRDVDAFLAAHKGCRCGVTKCDYLWEVREEPISIEVPVYTAFLYFPELRRASPNEEKERFSSFRNAYKNMLEMPPYAIIHDDFDGSGGDPGKDVWEWTVTRKDLLPLDWGGNG